MAAHGNGQHLRLEPGAVTVGADTCRHVALDVLAYSFANASRVAVCHSLPLTTLLHGAIAPPSRLNSGWVTISSASISCCVPRPVQVGHAPCGLLKLKVRGAISGRLMPQ